MSKALKIGQLAQQSGVSVQTLRYYEQRGLIPTPQRQSSGYRIYPHETLKRLSFINRCKTLGFSLEEILELLQMEVDPSHSAADVKARVDEKLALVEAKIADLQHLKLSLQQLSGSCCGHGSTSECPILEFLHEGETGQQH